MHKIRYFGILVMLLTIYFSNTPNLIVSDIDTWTNNTKYEHLSIFSFLSSDSEFFTPWGDYRDTDFYLHKISHITFYALMAFFYLYKSNSVMNVVNKLLFIFVFALSDEIHQYFIVGRAGRLIDSCLDMLSVFFVFFLLLARKKLLKVKKTEEA